MNRGRIVVKLKGGEKVPQQIEGESGVQRLAFLVERQHFDALLAVVPDEGGEEFVHHRGFGEDRRVGRLNE